MKATETKLLEFLKGPKQFVIPIYQRTYSWTPKQCEQLWKDIIRSTDESVSGHFIGSIVYIEKGLYQISSVSKLFVIDGQQRLTTISLMLSAFGRAIREQGEELEISQKKLNNYFLFNSEEEGDLHYKLLLTQSDKHTLIRLFEEKELPDPTSKRVIENYEFFEKKIRESGIDLMTLYQGIAKLIIVDISLDREHDNPQLIFESLNSTGLELSQADLIRNYVLMGLEPEEQKELYNDFWYPMEQGFGHTDYVARFDRFMRDYLTVKTGRIPNIREVYEAFKGYARDNNRSIRNLLADIYSFSKYFVNMALLKEDDKELKKIFIEINTLKVDVAYPFLLELYDDYNHGRLDYEEFVGILRLVENYVFRRTICGIPTNSLNKTFATMSRELDKEHYLESFKVALFLKDSYRRFPSDDEFVREFVVKDLYSIRSRNYLLRKLENHDHKERVNVEDFTIEHIMPQNENLSLEWQQDLGSDWKEIQSKYLHTLGNLTLTGYNPELGDRPFIEKRDMKGGFADSPLRLNRCLAKVENWNEAEIQKRANTIAKLATEVWSSPVLPVEVLEKYKSESTSNKGEIGTIETMEGSEYLQTTMQELFDQLRKHILNLDSSVREEPKRHYIAYKTTTNFVDIVLQKSRLQLSLNMAFDEIYDPKGLCKDVSNLGRWGNGDVEVGISSLDQLEDIMFLIKQSFEKHVENGDD
ncbi:MAG: DUF262 and DUF1524 domain-containing protein [Methanococcoides sp.]|nr:DUF262 and DUF1524 domain-containing protein [Methanococcoides sp.]